MCFLSWKILGELGPNTPSTDRVTPKQDSDAEMLPQPTSTVTGSIAKHLQPGAQPVTTQSKNSSHSNTTKLQVTNTSTPSVLLSAKSTTQLSKTVQRGRHAASTTVQSLKIGKKQEPCVLCFLCPLVIQNGIICAAGTFLLEEFKKKSLQRRGKVDTRFHGKWGCNVWVDTAREVREQA